MVSHRPGVRISTLVPFKEADLIYFPGNGPNMFSVENGKRSGRILNDPIAHDAIMRRENELLESFIAGDRPKPSEICRFIFGK